LGDVKGDKKKSKRKKSNPMGRPRIPIDLEAVKGLGKLQCTYQECADFLTETSGKEVKVSTLSMRPDFLEAYKKGASLGKMSLRRWQLRAAESGNSALLIFLGKNMLGQTDKVESDDSPEELLDKIADLGRQMIAKK
jgi:hypothetical protein